MHDTKQMGFYTGFKRTYTNTLYSSTDFFKGTTAESIEQKEKKVLIKQN